MLWLLLLLLLLLLSLDDPLPFPFPRRVGSSPCCTSMSIRAQVRKASKAQNEILTPALFFFGHGGDDGDDGDGDVVVDSFSFVSSLLSPSPSMLPPPLLLLLPSRPTVSVSVAAAVAAVLLQKVRTRKLEPHRASGNSWFANRVSFNSFFQALCDRGIFRECGLLSKIFEDFLYRIVHAQTPLPPVVLLLLLLVSSRSSCRRWYFVSSVGLLLVLLLLLLLLLSLVLVLVLVLVLLLLLLLVDADVDSVQTKVSIPPSSIRSSSFDDDFNFIVVAFVSEK